jgi:hypothetical protein
MTNDSTASSVARDALDAALAEASNDPDDPHRLTDGECTLGVPLPAGLVDGLDEVVLTVRLSGDIVSFTTPLASVTDGGEFGEVATALLRRQFFAAQTEGASFALADREDVVVATYHWMPEAITTDGFSGVFSRFVSAALHLRGELAHMASQGAPLAMLDSAG